MELFLAICFVQVWVICVIVYIVYLPTFDLLKDLKAQRNELERENLILTTRLNQLKIDMEI